MAESRVFIITFHTRNNIEFRTECCGLAEMVRAFSAASILINPPSLTVTYEDPKVFSLLKHFEERNYSQYECGGIYVREIGAP